MKNKLLTGILIITFALTLYNTFSIKLIMSVLRTQLEIEEAQTDIIEVLVEKSK